jgi:hypothetical protein
MADPESLDPVTKQELQELFNNSNSEFGGFSKESKSEFEGSSNQDKDTEPGQTLTE